MLLMKILWFGLILIFLIWLVVDVIDPLMTNKPMFGTFKRSKRKQVLIEHLKQRNAELEELLLEKKVAQADVALDKLEREVDGIGGNDVKQTEKE